MTARNPGLELPKCDAEILEKGAHVATVIGAAEDIEAWVKEVARLSGQRVDWHYMAGRGVVWALGDLEKVELALAKCREVLVGDSVPEFYQPSSRVYHRQIVEIGIAGPRPAPAHIDNPHISIFQDRCFWLTSESGHSQIPGLTEWMQRAQPGDTFIWMNPLSKAFNGGQVYVCVDLWYEDKEES